MRHGVPVPFMLVALLTALLLACGSTATPTATPAGAQPTIASTTAQTATPIPVPTVAATATEAAPTETVAAPYSIEALSVANPAPAGSIYEPEAGTVLVGVEVVVTNTGTDVVKYNVTYTTMVDADGFVYTAELGSVTGQIDLVDLGPGQKVRGWVGFAVPPGTVPALIRWQSSFNGPVVEATIAP